MHIDNTHLISNIIYSYILGCSVLQIEFRNPEIENPILVLKWYRGDLDLKNIEKVDPTPKYKL